MLASTPETLFILGGITLLFGLILAANVLSLRVDAFLEKVTGSAFVPVYLLMMVALFGLATALHLVSYLIWSLI